MKKLLFLCFTACFSVWASAQKVYFLYLQSDDQLPFYVKMGDKIHSSAASGYLIIPNLIDSTYTFGLGFAKSRNPEARFAVSINQNDKGFLIKNFEDGLSLFNIQDLSIVKSNNAAFTDNTVYEIKSDKFSSILSKAASDPSLLKVPVVKKEEPAKQKTVEKEIVTAKTEEVKPQEKAVVTASSNQPETERIETTTARRKDPEAENNTATPPTIKEAAEPAQPVRQVATKEPAVEVQQSAYKPSIVNRISESSTTEGFGVVYSDKKENGIDTIRILIPSPKVRLVAEGETSVAETAKSENNDLSVVVKKEQVESSRSTQIATPAANSLSNCKSIASDKDFMNLRKRMAAKDNDDAMLDEARKAFRGKCYSVEQVRYLSSLFLTSAAKYQFFDAAFSYVSDKANFPSLAAEIKDEHYTKRFKALIGE